MYKKICINGLQSRVTAIIGGQFGDQGKGKLVDFLAQKYQVCARFNGGANAGHTVVVNGKKFEFHLLPCGMLYKNCLNIIGNGVVIHLQSLMRQLNQLKNHNIDYIDRLKISNRAHIVTQFHIQKDIKNEVNSYLGTTKKGIGPTYSSKSQRIGLRICDLQNWNYFLSKYDKFIQFYQYDKQKTQSQLNQLKQIIADTSSLINQLYYDRKKILLQGANATMLDIDHGTYPFVTSSNTTIGGISTGLGFNPRNVQTVIGIIKAYTTRVGKGPFPTEADDHTSKILRTRGNQFGTTTRRPRRCGWLDIPMLKYSIRLNGFDSLNLTKLDVLNEFEQIKICIDYEWNGQILDDMPGVEEKMEKIIPKYISMKGWKSDIRIIRSYQALPFQAKQYIKCIQQMSGVKVSWIGTGPQRSHLILKQ